jgi:hypothetical protein
MMDGEQPENRPYYRDLLSFLGWQVLFETPDRILIEVVYIGPKA